MKKTEFSEILSLLSEREFLRFGEFVHSPYFQTDARLQKACRVIYDKYNGFKDGTLGRDYLVREVMGKSAGPGNARKLVSDVLKLFDRFFIYEELAEDSSYQKIALLRQLNKRKWKSRFEQKSKSILKAHSEEGVYDENYYKLTAEVNDEIFSAEPQSEFYRYSPSLQQKADSLDMQFIAAKLYVFQLMFSKQYLNKEELNYRWEFWEELRAHIEMHLDDIKMHHPEIYLRYLMIKMLDFSEDSPLIEYQNTLANAGLKLNKSRLAAYYSDLYNYLTMRISRGEHKFRRPLYDMFKALDSGDLIAEFGSGQITYYTFKQIVDTCIYLRELDWLEYFLNKYGGSIDDPNRNDISNLAYAKFYYYSNDFIKARLALGRVSTKDFIHYLDAKLLLTGIEYDTENYIEVFEIINSVKKYLKSRRGIPKYLIEGTNRYISCLLKLIWISENPASVNAGFELNALEASLNDERGTVYAKTWLEERIQAIKERQR